ncbi:hypothetical protein PCK2_000861 [Pneumocystis canis]|nr:hypothetical protein PCK2_000861 [Pneumocystis canis]
MNSCFFLQNAENHWFPLYIELNKMLFLEKKKVQYVIIYNNIAKASQLPPKSDYHLFKTGVRPEWEDKQNQKGGRWSYNNKDRRSVNIDELWLHIMLAAIGETLENEGDNEVMGVVVNIRKGFVRLGLWTRSTSNEEVLRAIGKRFREAMKISDKETVEFYSHSDSAHSGSTRAKSRMYA